MHKTLQQRTNQLKSSRVSKASLKGKRGLNKQLILGGVKQNEKMQITALSQRLLI